MSKISSMMDVGKRSLQNSQTSLQTVAHNISNKSTEGYSRQRVDLMTNPPVGEGNLRIGMGARAGVVSRTNNPWLEKQLQKENTNMGFADSKADALSQVEQIYNEQSNKGLNQYMSDFFNAFRELSNTPESLTSRSMVREAGNALTGDFQRVTGQLKGVQDDLDGQIIVTVNEVNQLTKEVASLNEKIQQVEIQGNPANDERDRRDLLLKKLGEKIEISYAEGKDGHVNVSAGNTAVLVSGTESQDLRADRGGDRNRVEILYRSNPHGTWFNVTQQIKGGKVGGALEIRDELIEDHLKSIDAMAYTLAKEVNSSHIEGYDQKGKPGILFFDMPEDVKGAAERIRVNESIKQDVGRIATAARPNAPGDNTVANMISSLQHRGVMDGGATLDDYYNSQVGQIGAITQRAVKGQESQKNILSQLTNIRESISGVSLDEEATKMIEMQKAYDASARLIKTADEMFDTVLNLKRL